MSKIENHKFTIEEALKQNFYVVPDYQREYVWKEREVNQILDDFYEQLGGKLESQYFIGMVLVAPAGSSRFEIIDGQQRLTTLFLLIGALRKKLLHVPGFDGLLGNLLSSTYTSGTGSIVSSLRLDPRYENAAKVVEQLVTTDISVADLRVQLQADGIPFAGSVANLVNAFETIWSFLESHFPTSKELSEFWGFVANQVLFIQIETDVSNALKIFETINERGIGLSPMDLLKNLLFTHVQPEDFAKLKQAWSAVTAPLEAKREKPLRFLRYFLMASYPIQPSAKDTVIREDEIYDWLTDPVNRRAVGYDTDPFPFVNKLANSVQLYLGFTQGKDNLGNESTAMRRLQRMTGGAFSLHYVLLLAAAGLPKNLFELFVENLESYLFFYIFTKTPSKELERNFAIWADELRAIATAPDPKADLDDFVAERFGGGMRAKERELRDALGRYTIRSMQRYRTSYLLGRIAEHISRAVTGSSYKGVQDIGPYFDYEVEHILAETPSDELRSDWARLNPDSDYDDAKVSLGNLTLLEKPLNILASNNPFELKLSHYAKSDLYLTSSLVALKDVGINTSVTHINGYLESATRWDAQAIAQRQGRLTDLVLDIWRIRE